MCGSCFITPMLKFLMVLQIKLLNTSRKLQHYIFLLLCIELFSISLFWTGSKANITMAFHLGQINFSGLTSFKAYLTEYSGKAIIHLYNIRLSNSINNVCIQAMSQVQRDDEKDCWKNCCHTTERYDTASPMHFANS